MRTTTEITGIQDGIRGATVKLGIPPSTLDRKILVHKIRKLTLGPPPLPSGTRVRVLALRSL
jgi:hypothetical protein